MWCTGMSAGLGDSPLGTTDTACIPVGEAARHYENNSCLFYLTKLLEGSKRIMDVTYFKENAKRCRTIKNYITVGSTSKGPFWKVKCQPLLLEENRSFFRKIKKVLHLVVCALDNFSGNSFKRPSLLHAWPLLSAMRARRSLGFISALDK